MRETLDECMPGRYALGSGNTIENYIPVENYLAMLEEGLRWKDSTLYFRGDKISGHGMAAAEIFLGIIMTIVWVVILIIMGSWAVWQM